MEDRRFIEETFPVKEIGEEAAKEKSIRHGHISTLHIWWARRPLAASRSTIYAALIPATENVEESKSTKEFIVTLSRWENATNIELLRRAQKAILERSGSIPPRVLDPFGGGGSIPLESLRLGCETYASDYNPVSTLLLKAVLEFPQTYHLMTAGPSAGKSRVDLAQDVKRWGDWVLEKVKEDIGKFYSSDEKDGSVVGYVWSRTILCQNPSCGAEIPLIRQFVLSRRGGKKIALYPLVNGKKVSFVIVGSGYKKIPSGFDPETGTVLRTVATCLVCGSTVDDKTVRNLFRSGKADARIVAVVSRSPGRSGKKYRPSSAEDALGEELTKYLEEKEEQLTNEWGMPAVPDEPTPEGKGSGAERAFSVKNFGMDSWGDLFNARQKLALLCFVKASQLAHTEMIKLGYGEERARVVATYLGLAIDRLADYNSSLTRWHVGGEKVGNTFTRQVLPMVWDYFELVPWSQASGDWNSALGWITRVIKEISVMPLASAKVSNQSATKLGHPDEYFDAVFTDPPYYDNVPYSYLSDFFYVWLKRSIGSLYPDLFATPLTPKSDEIVAYSKDGDLEAGKRAFETLLKRSFAEIDRVLKPDGVCIVVFAHKSTAGWETLLNSLLDSGLTITGAWPLHTEMSSRLRASESAALASSIYMVARKSTKIPIGFYGEVKAELRKHLTARLDDLWEEKIVGADFLISAIGASIEIFGKYQSVMDDGGNRVGPSRLLEDVRKTVTDYAVRKVLHNGFSAEISRLTRFYILWRWAYGELEIDFDDAHKLAQSVGIDLPKEWNKGFIIKDKESIIVQGPEERDLSSMSNPKELIDVLHYSVVMWKNGKHSEMSRVLKESGFGTSDIFYRVGQAVAESLPSNSSERKLLEGFLNSRERLREELREETVQRRLFE